MGGFLTCELGRIAEAHLRPNFGHLTKLAIQAESQSHFDQVSSTERQHPRYAHDVAIAVHFTKRVANGQPKTITTEGRTNNVSRGGLSANVSDEVPTGADIEIDITLVFDDGMQSEALRLPARIAWCTKIDDGYQLGVSFKPLSGERAEYLQLFLKYLDGERAAKQPRTKTLDIDKRFG